ncbi:525_t:CDS:2, partial [Racocetra persica]
EENFSVFEAATDQDIERLWELVLEVDDLLIPKDTSKKHIENKVINVSTSPTTITIDGLGINEMGFSSRVQYAKNICALVKYIECNHLRVLYSQYHLNPEKENFLKNFLETIDYTCGTTFYEISDLTKASLFLFRNDNNCNINNDKVELQDVDNDINSDVNYDDDNMEDGEKSVDAKFADESSVDESFTELQNTKNGLSLETLFKRVFVNAKLTCVILMEILYFSSHLYLDVCFQYGDTEIFSPTSAGEQPYCSEYYTTIKTKKKKAKVLSLRLRKKAVKKRVMV